MREICTACSQRTERMEATLQDLVTLLNGKVDKLIDTVSGKKQVPLEVFNRVTTYTLIFCFLVFFGFEGLEKVIHFWK